MTSLFRAKLAISTGGRNPDGTHMLLGSGAYGRVFKRDENTAVKVIRRKNYCHNWTREVAASVRCNHPNIVKFSSIKITQTKISLYMPLYHKDMYKLIQETRPAPLEHHADLFRQLVDALKHMDDAGVQHRDLKPSNVMLDSEAKNAVIIDFGMTTHNKDKNTPGVTTINYRAPEMALGSTSYPKADMWSLGCIAEEMMGSNELFPVHSEVDLIVCIAISNLMDEDFVDSCNLPHVTHCFPPRRAKQTYKYTFKSPWAKLLVRMDPARRFSAAEVLNELKKTPVIDRVPKRMCEDGTDAQIKIVRV